MSDPTRKALLEALQVLLTHGGYGWTDALKLIETALAALSTTTAPDADWITDLFHEYENTRQPGEYPHLGQDNDIRRFASWLADEIAALATTPAPLDEDARAAMEAVPIHEFTSTDDDFDVEGYRDALIAAALSTTPAPLDAALERLDEDDIDYRTDPAGPTALEPNEPELWVRYAALAREYAKLEGAPHE